MDGRVVECVDQGRDTKDVRQEDELLADGRARLADPRQELDGVVPFVGRDAAWRVSFPPVIIVRGVPGLVNEVVHVMNEVLEDEFVAAVVTGH